MHAEPATLVVVGFAEALAAPEVVWSLVEAGCAVVAFSRVGKPAALSHSRHAQVHKVPDPETDLEGSLAGLRQLLDRVRDSGDFSQHVLLPLDDAALLICSRVSADSGWTFAGPPNAAAVELALDKQRQIETAKAAGLEVPDTLIATDWVDLQSLPFPLPVILRPALAIQESGARLRKGKNWICANQGELRAAATQWKGEGPLLIQPYLDGVGEGIFGLATDEGVSFWSGHRRIRMMNPHGSGSSACVSRPVDESIKAPITAFLGSVGWRGMFMLEMLRTPAGRLQFVEFNGRAWGSMALARRQGFEYPAWTVQLALGERSTSGQMPTSARA